MSYTKTNWNRGDIITAEKLNKIENGIYNIYPRIINPFELEGVYLVSEINGQQGDLLGYKYQTGLTEQDFFGSILYTEEQSITFYGILNGIVGDGYLEAMSDNTISIDTPYIMLSYSFNMDGNFNMLLIYLSELGGLFIEPVENFNPSDLLEFIEILGGEATVDFGDPISPLDPGLTPPVSEK